MIVAPCFTWNWSCVPGEPAPEATAVQSADEAPPLDWYDDAKRRNFVVGSDPV